MKNLVMVGLAGTNKDFIVSIPTLISYLQQFKEITNNYNITKLNYKLNVSIKLIVKEINKLNPDIIGFSVYMWNKAKIRKIKDKLNKNIQIIYGGPDITPLDKNNGNEYFIYGEGEEQLYKLLTGKTPPYQPYNERPSIYTNGLMDKEFKVPKIRVSIETQKGCTQKCKYCLYHKNEPIIKYRNINIILDELAYVKKMGIKEIRILDANFFSNYDRACYFFEELVNRNINFNIVIESCPRMVSDRFANAIGPYIKKGNKVITSFGVQSITPKVLKEINRYRNEEIEIKCFKKLTELGLIIKTDLILGLPYDTMETYLKSLDYIVNLMGLGKHAVGLQILRVLPNTEIHNLIEKHGIKYHKDYQVYKTNHMNKQDMIDCSRKNGIVMRIFSFDDIDNKLGMRKMFFETKKRTKKTNMELIQILQDKLMDYLKDTNSPYVKPTYPKAEIYYYIKIHTDVPAEWIKETLRGIK